VLGVRHGDVFADRAHRRIEEMVLHLLVDLELRGEGAQQVAARRVLPRRRLDPLEQAAQELVVLVEHLVGLPPARSVAGVRRRLGLGGGGGPRDVVVDGPLAGQPLSRS
jgi:hypothetical protein